MGYNTTVVVFSDALDSIAKDPDFGKNLSDAILQSRLSIPAVRVSSGGSSAACVIETHHADGFSIVAVGGNDGVQLGSAYYVDLRTQEGQEKILEQLANELGYTVKKKPSTTKPSGA